MVIDVKNPPQPKYWESTPIIKTELIQIGELKMVKATVIAGQMTISAFSGAVQEVSHKAIQDYARQATQRATRLVPRN